MFRQENRDAGLRSADARLPNPTEPVNLEMLSGRGLLLIRTFMDEVTFSDKGNQITMVKRRGHGRKSKP